MTRLVVYFPSWAQYRSSADGGLPAYCDAYALKPRDLDPLVPTHINYAFAAIDGDTFQVVDADESDPALQRELQALKKQNRKLRTLISIGGWSFSRGEDSAGTEKIFPTMASTAENRAKFIQSMIDFCRKRGFDGVDLDWEYPNYDNSNPREVDDFTILLAEARAAFNKEACAGRRRLLLTAAIPADPRTSFNLTAIKASLDFINLMSYDFAGPWSLTDGQGPLALNAPMLDCAGGFDIRSSIDLYLAAGVSPHQINQGLATYGRGFATTPGSSILPGAASAVGVGVAGECTQEEGSLAWFEIKRKVPTADIRIDEKALAAYASFDGGRQWIGFDNVESHRLKMCYARSLGLGGVMVWEASLDDNMELIRGMRQNLAGCCRNFSTPSCS